MTFRYLPAFLKLLSKLSPSEKRRSQDTLNRVIDFFETGLHPKGLGLKKLRKDYWEVRVDLSLRILFELRQSNVAFVVIGNHNDIQRTLKQV